jgi:hypothetical protein
MAEDKGTSAPTFEGGDSYKFERWLENFEAFLCTKRITAEDQELAGAYLKLALKGEARDLVEGLDSQGAMQSLRTHFGLTPEIAVPTAQREIQERRWRRGDTVTTFMTFYMQRNRRLRRMERGFTDQELKNIVFPNLPMTVKILAGTYVANHDVTFEAWLTHVAQLVTQGQIEIQAPEHEPASKATAAPTALYTHGAHGRNKGKEGARGGHREQGERESEGRRTLR